MTHPVPAPAAREKVGMLYGKECHTFSDMTLPLVRGLVDIGFTLHLFCARRVVCLSVCLSV